MPQTLRPPAWQRVLAPAAIGLLSALAVGAAVDAGGLFWIAGVLGEVMGLAAGLRSLALRVEVRAGELLVVNWTRSVHLPWSEVHRAGHDADGLWIRRRDGSVVRVSAFQHGHRALAFARKPAATAARRVEAARKGRRRKDG